MTAFRYDVNIGTNIFSNTPCALGYEKAKGIIVPFLTAKVRDNDHRLQFSFDATDEAGNTIHIRNNIPVGVDKDKYDVSHLARQNIVVEKSTGKTILDIRKSGLIEIYGDFYIEGKHIVADKLGLKIETIKLSKNRFTSLGGILITDNGISLGFRGTIPELPDVE
jgi:hypothetical protein